MKTYSLTQLAEHVQTRLEGDPSIEIKGVGSIHSATQGQITFFDKRKLDPALLKNIAASAVVLTADLSEACNKPRLISNNPYLTFVSIADLFSGQPQPVPGIHTTAVIEEGCRLGENVAIGAGVFIGQGTIIGNDCVIAPNCSIAAACEIGEACYLFSNVVLNHHVRLGNRVILHPGSVIGSDGFGLLPDKDGHWIKIPHCGSAILEDDVEIGANTTIDRGTFDNTVIAQGAKIDNQVQIAHNVQIGEHTAIAGCVGIAGSSSIGRHCRIGGGARISGHIEICDGVTVTGMSVIEKSITKAGFCTLQSPRSFRKGDNSLKNSLSKLEQRIEKLESALLKK